MTPQQKTIIEEGYYQLLDEKKVLQLKDFITLISTLSTQLGVSPLVVADCITNVLRAEIQETETVSPYIAFIVAALNNLQKSKNQS